MIMVLPPALSNDTIPNRLDNTLLEDTEEIVPSLITNSKNSVESHDFWKLCTKVKATTPNGFRLENLTWRLMHLRLKDEKIERPVLKKYRNLGKIISVL